MLLLPISLRKRAPLMHPPLYPAHFHRACLHHQAAESSCVAAWASSISRGRRWKGRHSPPWARSYKRKTSSTSRGSWPRSRSPWKILHGNIRKISMPIQSCAPRYEGVCWGGKGKGGRGGRRPYVCTSLRHTFIRCLPKKVQSLSFTCSSYHCSSLHPFLPPSLPPFLVPQNVHRHWRRPPRLQQGSLDSTFGCR